MAAALQLTKTLTATATLGRISSAYPDGRPVLETWMAPIITCPRPIEERRDGTAPSENASYRLGLHAAFWDRWVAGEPFDPCITIIGGAAPFRIWLSDETVDGVSASTGITTAEFPEDENVGANVLRERLYHAGFTAPSGGTKVIGFTINVRDCADQTTSVPVSTTIYARDHASIRTHFAFYKPDAGVDGDGTPDSPYNAYASLWGTDWSVARDTTAIVVIKGGGTFSAASTTNNPASAPDSMCIGAGKRPRQIVWVRGATVEMDCTTQGGIAARSSFTADVLVHNAILANGVHKIAVDLTFGRYRSYVHGTTFKDWDVQAGAGENLGPVYFPSDLGYYQSVQDCTSDNVFDSIGTSVNGNALMNMFHKHYFAANRNTYINRSTAIGSFIRFKHCSHYCEARDNTSLGDGFGYNQGCLTFSGGGEDNAHEYLTVRGNACYAPALSAKAIRIGADSAPSDHTILLFANTFQGPMEVAAQTGGQLKARRNLIQNADGATNAGFGTLDVDWIAVDGAIVADCIGATSGLLNADGTPVDAAYTGFYGHTTGL